MKKALTSQCFFYQNLVPGAGLEPARLAAGDFESPTSTNFITRAGELTTVFALLSTYF
jgi:hypothetical protein